MRGNRRSGTRTSVTNAAGGNSTFKKPTDFIGQKTFGSLAGYAAYANQFICDVNIPGCTEAARVFVGQRKDPFVVALGRTFDDFLLDRGRNPEVIDLLKNEQRTDPLLLRLALAYSALHDQNAGGAIAALTTRFDAARLRGDNVHRREEARFRLHLLHQPQAALSLALANWEVQKEPADARILFEAARAAQQNGTAGAARAFAQSHGWSNQQLATYLR